MSKKLPKHKLIPPAGLSAPVLRYFHVIAGRLAEERRDLPAHTELVVTTAKRLAEVDTLEECIREFGLVREEAKDRSKAPMLRMNPAVAALDRAQKHLHGLLVSLRLTPDSVKNLAGGPEDSAWNEFA